MQVRLLSQVCGLMLATSMAGTALAGDLFPPAGPPSPTMKRIDQVESSVCIDTVPFTITQPGTYTLCGNLRLTTGGSSGITIACSDVVIDGRGYVLSGIPSSLDGVLVQGTQNNVTIQDLTVRSFAGKGVHLASGQITCKRVTSENNGGDGFDLSSAQLIESTSRFNGGDGMRLSAGHGHVTVLKACDTSNNGGHGVSLHGVDSFFDITYRIDDLSSSSNGGSGLRSSGGGGGGAGGRIAIYTRSSSFTGNSSGGLVVDVPSSLVCSVSMSDVEASHNTGHGIHLSHGGGGSGGSLYVSADGARCVGNTVDGYLCDSEDGLDAESSVLKSVMCSGNGGNGMTLSSVATLEACDFSDNDGHGLEASSRPGKTKVGRVTLSRFSGNGGDGLSASCPLSLHDSSFTDNGGSGVHSISKTTDKSTPVLFEKARASRNAAHGFLFSSSEAGDKSSPKLAGCRSSGNGGHGVHVSLTHENAVSRLSLHGTDCDDNDGDGVHFSMGTLTVQGSLSVDSSSFSSNTGGGLVVVTDGFPGDMRCAVSNSLFVDNGGDGMQMGKVNKVESISIKQSSSSGNGGSGFSCGSSSMNLEMCSSSGNDEDGFSLSSATGGRVEACSSSSNSGRGITINTSHVEYSSNSCSSNGDSGVVVASGTGNVLHGNFLSGNTGTGVSLLSGGNRLYESATGVQTSPLFEAGGVTNDFSPGSSAAAGGSPNIGF